MRAKGKPRSRFRTGVVAALVLVAAAAPARAQEPARSLGSRFYAGLGLSSVNVDDSYGGVSFSDSTLGLGAYGGFWMKDQLALELSYNWLDAFDLHDLAGSGVVKFDVTSKRQTLSLSVLREVTLRDFLNLKRDWRVYGALGLYDTRAERTVTDLASGAQISANESVSGALIEAGGLYKFGRVELRGYLRGWGDAKEIGAAAQFRF